MLTSTSTVSRAAARGPAPALSLRKALVAKPALLPARNAFAAASSALAAVQKSKLRSSALYQRHARARAAVMASAVSASSQDLLIVGPGVLGSYLGKLWKEQYPNAAVTGQTNSATNHERLTKMGINPVIKTEAPAQKYSYVLFSAPPSGSQDYVGEVKAALDKWDGTGSFVFTSSNSVCEPEDGSVVTEHTPTVAMGKAASTDKLLQAEAAVSEGNGNVVRLVGLYHCQRGAHTFFLKMKEVARPGGYVVNLIHYEDAARLAMSVLQNQGSEEAYRGQLFLGCDNHPITFADMMEACTSSGVFQGEVNFTGSEASGLGKQVNNSKTLARLGWQPKYSSFKEFMMAGGKDFYNTSGLF